MKSLVHRLSIITPSYNRVQFIVDAIESVLIQNHPDFEHIIIDKGSIDGTLDVLQKYPHVKIMTGPDKGMYDALNKGLEVASGEIIAFLNTDDYYTPDTFAKVVNLFAQNQVDAIAGRADYVIDKLGPTNSAIRKSLLLTDKVFWREIAYGEPAFNAWFFHRSVFDILGKFDINYQIAGDRDFLIRFALSELKHIAFDDVVYRYRVHDGSLSMTKSPLEFSRVADENLRLADHYMNILPVNAQPYMQRVRTRDTITAASRNLRGAAFQKALHYAKLGWKSDLLWPVKFVFRVAAGIFRLVSRKFSLCIQI